MVGGVGRSPAFPSHLPQFPNLQRRRHAHGAATGRAFPCSGRVVCEVNEAERARIQRTKDNYQRLGWEYRANPLA